MNSHPNPAHSPASIVAIVGRPNVGKSTLFNRLVGARLAIVEDRPGVTRDRLYGEAHWLGSNFLVVDTGGIDPSLDTGLPQHIRRQAQVAVEEADLILLIVDAHEGVTSVDLDIVKELRRSGKPVVVVANKADSPRYEVAAAELHCLGIGEVYAVSAAHGRGMGDLCDAILEQLPRTSDEAIEVVPPGLRLAFIGRPNVGKSTLINTLLEEPRVIVDEVAGTTRDPIYLPFRYRERDLVLIDTAGLRRRKQVAKAMEKLAAIKSIRTMERTQIVVLVINAFDGVSDQDQRLANMAFERGKGVVIVLHQWDRVVGDSALARKRMQETEESFAFLERPFIVKTSVVGEGRDVGMGKGTNLEAILEACQHTSRAWARRIETPALNAELQSAVLDHSPPLHQNKPVRLYFVTQADTEPPFIVISANRGRCLAPAYERYLLRRFRRRWNLRGVPVRLVVRGRNDSPTSDHSKPSSKARSSPRSKSKPKPKSRRAEAAAGRG